MNSRLERIDSHLFQEVDENSSRQLVGGLGITFSPTVSVTVSGGAVDSETDATVDPGL